MENFLGDFWSFLGRPRSRDGHSQIPYEKCLPNQGSKPKSGPWEAISWSFSIFGESLCGCFVYVVLLLLIVRGESRTAHAPRMKFFVFQGVSN